MSSPDYYPIHFDHNTVTQHDIAAFNQMSTDEQQRFLQVFTQKEKAVIEHNDHTGLSFWLMSAVMLTAAVFFFFNMGLVPRQWATGMVCNGLVCGVAWHHYIYMKDTWAETKSAPTVYRYMDWLVTVPLQVVQFYNILQAATPPAKGMISTGILYRLIIYSTLMLGFGYCGESGIFGYNGGRWAGFVFGMFFWCAIVFEVFYIH